MSIEQEELENFGDYQRQAMLDMVRRSEAMMAEFNSLDVVNLAYDAFVRVGLPIIHGVLRDEINPDAWIHFIGGTNQRVVVHNEDGPFLNIPPIFATIPTNVYAEAETPTFFSFVGELNMERRQHPEMWEAVVGKRLENSFADIPPSFEFFKKINELFIKYGLPEIKVEDFVAKESDDTVKPVAVESKPAESVEINVTVFDEGELC